MAAPMRSGRGVDGKPGKRCELTDEGWERIVDLLPAQARGGRWREHRLMLDGMFWVLNSGAPWRDMPDRYGKWETVHGRYRRWTRESLFERFLGRLHLALDEQGRIDWGVFDVDGSDVRAHRSAAEASKKTSAGRTLRPRPGTIPRRLWYEASSCDRRSRSPAGHGGDAGAGARVEVVRGADGHGAHRTATASRRGRGRQRVQLPAHPSVAAWAVHRSRDPDAIGPAWGADEQGEVSASQRGRALHRLARELPSDRDPLRHARRPLPLLRHAGHDPALHAAARSVRHNLGRKMDSVSEKAWRTGRTGA